MERQGVRAIKEQGDGDRERDKDRDRRDDDANFST